MRVPNHPTQIRRMRDSRLKQLTPTGPVLAANLTQVHKHCGQPSCACYHGGPLHVAHLIGFTQAGKTRSVYVPQDLLHEVRTWVQEYQRIKTLLHEITQLNVALIRGHVANRKRRQGRP
jgi:hypothetical protein